MGWLGALATLAGPMVARVLMALGMSVVTITGVDVAMGQVKPIIVAQFSQAPLAAIQLAGLSGCWLALGMIFGALTFALSFWSLTQATKIIGKGA